jgi:hypothetical protein
MRRIITAVFESRQAAEAAQQSLRALGVPADRIGIHADPRGGSRPASDGAPGPETGLPALLDTLFLPDADFAAHREALRRGGVAISAEVEEAQAAKATEALDRAGAHDLDAQETAWRQEGWSPALDAGAVRDEPGATPVAMPGTGGMDAESARQLATGTFGTNTSGAATPTTQREGTRDPRRLLTRDPAFGRARSYVIEAPLAEEGEP